MLLLIRSIYVESNWNRVFRITYTNLKEDRSTCREWKKPSEKKLDSATCFATSLENCVFIFSFAIMFSMETRCQSAEKMNSAWVGLTAVRDPPKILFPCFIILFPKRLRYVFLVAKYCDSALDSRVCVSSSICMVYLFVCEVESHKPSFRVCIEREKVRLVCVRSFWSISIQRVFVFFSLLEYLLKHIQTQID